MYGERLAKWNKATDWPLIAAAIVFLIAYSVQILGPQEGIVADAMNVVLWVVWGAFLVDYVICISLAEHRGRWFVRHLLDLAIVVLPMLRPLRLMRFITILMIVQRNAGTALRGRVAVFTIGAAVLSIYVAALAVYDAESGGPGDIQTIGQATWWAFETITTVGYGDYVPVTTVGKIVAVALMIGGVAIIGVVSASLASWIVERVAVHKDAAAEREQAEVDATSRQIESLTAEVSALRTLLEGKASSGT